MKKNIIFHVFRIGFCATLLAVAFRSSANKKVTLASTNAVAAENTTKVEEFIALGTEPFWNVTIRKNGIVYSSPDTRRLTFRLRSPLALRLRSGLTFPYVTPLKAAGRPADLVRVYRLTSKGNSMMIILKKVSACSDGMSDKNYPYSATLILNNTVLEGCADKK